MRKEINVYSLNLTIWGNHYYQDVDISGYIPSGYSAIDASIADGISGGILNCYLKANKTTVRFLNDISYVGDQAIYIICVKNEFLS